jgi:hypothetical protein
MQTSCEFTQTCFWTNVGLFCLTVWYFSTTDMESVCFFFFECVLKTVHPRALHFETFSWVCFDCTSFRDIFVSSGGIGGYLNQFIEESWFWPAPFFTPSHPFKFWPCAGSIDPTIRDTYPKASLKKDPFHAAALGQVVSCQILLLRFGVIWNVCFHKMWRLRFRRNFSI